MVITVGYSLIYKISLLSAIIPSTLVVITAIASSKQMGGSLGQGLKKIAAGTIVHVTLFTLYLALEQGNWGILSEIQLRVFFLFCGIFASILLISGYAQIYTIARKLKLFTV